MIWRSTVEAERSASLTTLNYMVRAMFVMPPEQKERQVGPGGQPWAELLERLTRSLRSDLTPVIVPLLGELSRQAVRLTEGQRSLVGESARRMLAFAWDAPDRNSRLVNVSLEAVCRTYESEPAASETLLRRSLVLDHLAAHGYEEMPRLVEELKPLMSSAPDFVEAVYRSLLAHEETSNESIPMGTSAILPLRSNRRQDYELAIYTLGEIFPNFAESSPVQATGAVIAAVESTIAKKATVPLTELNGEPVQVGEKTARFALDGSYIWDSGDACRDETVHKMLDGFEKMLVELAEDPARPTALQDVLTRVVKENRFAAVWRRVLWAAKAAPNTLGMQVRSLLFSHDVLTSNDTSEPAGEFLRVVYPLLVHEEQERIEKLILAIPDNYKSDRKDLAERHRDRLLGCLPPGHVVTDPARQRIATFAEMGSPPPNDAPFRMRFVSRGEYSNRDWLRDKGVDFDNEANQLLMDRADEAEEFARSFLNDVPDREAVIAILPTLRTLHHELATSADRAHKTVVQSAGTSLLRCCATIARVDWLVNEPEVSGFLRQVLLETSNDDERYADSGVNEQFEETRSVSPFPRWYAADGLCRMARHAAFADEEILAAITKMSCDTHPAVRAEIGDGLGYLLTTARETALELLLKLSDDESVAVANAALIGAQGLLTSHPNVVEPLLIRAFERVGSGPRHDALRKSCLRISFSLNRGPENAFGGPITDRTLNDIVGNDDVACELVITISQYLFHGDLERSDRSAEIVRLRSIELLTTIAKRLASQHRILASKWNEHGSWSEEERAKAEAIHKIAHQIGIRLRVASEHLGGAPNGSDDQNRVRAQEIGVRFLREASDLLDTLLTIPFPDLIHAILEMLQQLADSDPGPVLLRIRTAVSCGQDGGYQFESLGVGLIVKLVRRYLADHRRLLQQDPICREAIVEILNVFVRAGWPEALELTFRLEDVFR
jgi:hypothetical protein